MDRVWVSMQPLSGTRYFAPRNAAGDFAKSRYIASMARSPDRNSWWVPRADIFLNSSGEFVAKIELAALSRENLELSCENQRILICGCRPDADRESTDNQYFITEISCGRFELVVDVPSNFDLSMAKASYQNGLLRIVVPPKS